MAHIQVAASWSIELFDQRLPKASRPIFDSFSIHDYSRPLKTATASSGDRLDITREVF
jgi:hypothetical protein